MKGPTFSTMHCKVALVPINLVAVGAPVNISNNRMRKIQVSRQALRVTTSVRTNRTLKSNHLQSDTTVSVHSRSVSTRSVAAKSRDSDLLHKSMPSHSVLSRSGPKLPVVKRKSLHHHSDDNGLRSHLLQERCGPESCQTMQHAQADAEVV